MRNQGNAACLWLCPIVTSLCTCPTGHSGQAGRSSLLALAYSSSPPVLSSLLSSATLEAEVQPPSGSAAR
jgi:hypothetical protein